MVLLESGSMHSGTIQLPGQLSVVRNYTQRSYEPFVLYLVHVFSYHSHLSSMDDTSLHHKDNE